MAVNRVNSTETILTFDNRDVSQWSMVWSTANVPGMDAAMGGGPTRRTSGRRRLRTGAFVLAAFLATHCKVSANAVSGSLYIFIMFLIISVVLLANPLRHFEVYLGQWSISGPGRAFRIIPMFDGIGIAICINAIVRAISCCAMAAIAAVYVFHSVSDDKLPFTYCRDFNLKPYEPEMKPLRSLKPLKYPWFVEAGFIPNDESLSTVPLHTTVGLFYNAWRNVSLKRDKVTVDSWTHTPQNRKMRLNPITIKNDSFNARRKRRKNPSVIPICKERYPGKYPPLFNTPAYNFFYVEVVQFRPNMSLTKFNVPLILCIITIWILLWMVMIFEHLAHGRLIWNNMYTWFVAVPWFWAVIVAVAAITNVTSVYKIFRKVFRLGAAEMVYAFADALEVSMYIHAASTGTELIHGKGLNHYASGHIDPNLNSDNVWHSGLVLFLAALNSSNAAICTLVDYMQITMQETHFFHESTLWILPMYSRCTSTGAYSHLLSTLTFSGLTFSYMVVAYVFLKTALHTIFEYRVKLVFIEQVIVALLMITCMGLSLFFATHGGLPLLESVDAVMTGLTMPMVCLFELIGLLYIYRSHDFISDMNIATEENTCAGRIGTQWQIIPFITLFMLGSKIASLVNSELPKHSIYLALAPFFAVLLAVPIRAICNLYWYLRSLKHKK